MEVDRVLIEKLRFSKLEAAQVKDILSNDTSFTKIEPHTELPAVCRDVDDNNVLRVAESIMADYIVTGDKDLLILEKYKHSYIISPKQFLSIIA